MTSSQKTSKLFDFIHDDSPIPPEALHYFRARLKNRLFDLVLRRFRERQVETGLTKADLARRLNRRPEVINRLLGAPGNWELETVSDLLLGIAVEELTAEVTSLNRQPTNFQFKPWIEEQQASYVRVNEHRQETQTATGNNAKINVQVG